MFNRAFDGKTSVVLLKSPVMQGQQIKSEMLSVVEMGSYNLPKNAITDAKLIEGKYAVSNLFAGSLVYPDMLSDTTDTSDTMLRNLKEHEIVMSVTITDFANGLSGKLTTGDIIKIVSVDVDKIATIYDELQYIEVLTTTTGDGVDNFQQPVPDENGEISLPVTITVILQDERQALRLAECENTSLHAIFVSRDDKKKKSEYIKLQADILEELRLAEEAEEAENAENQDEFPSNGGEQYGNG
ncbi:MAG: SAF domain-containing protein [Oscillospiraceae bacterium]|nr:SAF domain-containing protein [Oscillospiraceae bacterium]